MSSAAVGFASPSPTSCCCFSSTNPKPTSAPSQIYRCLRRSPRPHSVRGCYSTLKDSPSSSLHLPLLPFQSDEVLVPSESRTLHLYEARYLALLDESLFSKKKVFVHFVLDPVLGTDRSSSGASFAARYGCLVLIEKIERLEIGALVSIRGIGRVRIVDIIQMEPYLRGVVVPMQDNLYDYDGEIWPKVEQLRGSLDSLQQLQIKLKASKDELLLTQMKNSLTWAERELHMDSDQPFIPKLAERLSFAALQPVSGFSQAEALALQREKLQAMDTTNTLERLKMGIEFATKNIAIVAAKLVIQSLEL